MTDLMLQFPGVVADARGAFHARVGEARIAADAERLRAAAIQRIAVLRNAVSAWEAEGGAG
ncbi:MAG TPA: hypothetical protein VEP46_00350 [Vicinamibacterales bacterium]|nr:hypothetical protein [Vicinamibacterales bacterium]